MSSGEDPGRTRLRDPKGELARDIVRRCIAAGLPATWVTADEAYGQDWHFRRLLEQLNVGYVVAVPKSQQIKSLAGIWRIDELIDEAPADAWQRLSCGDGAKGPRVYDWAAAKLPANIIFDPDPPTHHRWVMARRSLSDPGELAYKDVGGRAAAEEDVQVPVAGQEVQASRPGRWWFRKSKVWRWLSARKRSAIRVDTSDGPAVTPLVAPASPWSEMPGKANGNTMV